MSLQQQFYQALDRFENSLPAVQATALFDSDGLVLASRLRGEADDQRIGAMSAAILSISSRSGQELVRGPIQRVLVEGELGSMLVTSVSPEVILVALVGAQVKLGILFYECRQCISQIQTIMGINQAVDLRE